MSTRPYSPPKKVIDAGDMSASITSSVSILHQKTGGSYSFSWSGTSPIGTAALQFSNDYSIDAKGVVVNAGTWNTAPLEVSGSGTQATDVAISGNSGNGFIEIWADNGFAARIVYTRVSGVGSLTVTYIGKVS